MKPLLWLGHPRTALPSLILTGPERRTLPVAVFNFISGDEIDWGGLKE